MTSFDPKHCKDLDCAAQSCQAVLKDAYLGPLRLKGLFTIGLTGGWVLDERYERQDAYCPEHRSLLFCSRKACSNQFTRRSPPFIHDGSGLPYCVSCARKINEAAGIELCKRQDP